MAAYAQGIRPGGVGEEAISVRSPLSLSLTGWFQVCWLADLRRRAGRVYPAPIPSQV
jgi:hypothetical protein